MQPLLPGRVLFRRFEIAEVLPSSRDVAVLVVLDRAAFGAERVLKIAAGRGGESERSARLTSEFRILAGLRHPGLVRALDFGLDLAEGRTWMLEERVPGLTLDKLAPFGFLEAAHVLVDVARALSHLHARGFLHGDLKPENILHDPGSGRTTIVDLDLAGPAGASAVGRGTFPYASPEAMGAGPPPLPASDLFSLGVILHELVTAKRLDALTPAVALDPGPSHPQALRELVARLTSETPSERPKSARDLIVALQVAGPRFPPESASTRRAVLRFPEFSGRADEARQVLEVVPAERRRRRETQFCVISGAPGVGKSRLLDELATEWRISGARVVVAGRSPGSRRTLEPVHELLGTLHQLEGGAAADVDVAVARAGASADLRAGLLDKLVERLLALVRRRRTILVFEDIHRFDEASREFVVALLRRATHETWETRGRAPVEIVLTLQLVEVRDEGLRTFLDAALDAGGVRLVELKPLGEEAEFAFLRKLAAPETVPGDVAARIRRHSGGIPMWIREILAAHPSNPHGSGTLLGSLADSADDLAALPDTLEHLARRRLAGVPATHLPVLLALAVLPGGASAGLVRLLTGDPGVQGVLDDLEERDHVFADGTRWHLCDETTRAILLGDADPLDLPRLRDRAAAALLAEAARADEIAYQELGGTDPLAGAARSLEAVPALLREGADEEAAFLLERMRSARVPSWFAKRWATIRLADVHVSRGRTSRARALLADPAAGDGARDRAILGRLASIDAKEGQIDSARRRLESIIGDDLAFSPEERTESRVGLAEILRTSGRTAEAGVLLEIVRTELSPLLPPGTFDDPATAVEDVRAPRLPWPGHRAGVVARFLTLAGDIAREEKKYGVGMRCFLAAMKIRARKGDLVGLARALHGAGTITMAAGQLPLAERYFSRALSLREETGDLAGWADSSNNLGVLLRRLGNSAEAIQHFRTSLRIRRQIGHSAGEAWSYINIANVHYEQRDLDAATRYLRRALLLVRQLSDRRSEGQILNNLGAIAHLRDRHREAIHRYREAEALDRLAGNRAAALLKRVNLAEAYVRAGFVARAVRALRGVGRDARRRGDIPVFVRAGLVRARARIHEGQFAEAAERLRALLVEAQPLHEVETVAELRVELARALRLSGRPGEALGALPEPWPAAGAEGRAHVAVERARALLDLGRDDLSPVLAEVLEAERFAERNRLPGLHLLCASARSAILQRLGDRTQALAACLAALSSLEGILRRLPEGRFTDAWIGTRPVREFLAHVESFAESLRPSGQRAVGGAAAEIVRRLHDALFAAEGALAASGGGTRSEDEIVRRVMDLGRALRSTAPLDELLREIVDAVVDSTRAERGFLVTVDELGRMRIPVARNRHRERIPDPEAQVSRRILNEVRSTSRSVRLQNAVAEGDYAVAESVVNLGLRSILCAPLLRATTVVGMLYVENRAKVSQFTAKDLEVLDVFASQAAIALENARLVREYARDEKLRVLGNLASGVAHDFNNLLAAIQGWAERLTETSTDEFALRGLRTISKAAQDGRVVVRRMQDFTRVRREQRFESVGLVEVFADVLEFTRSRWDREPARRGFRIAVVVDAPADLRILGDPAELREVFTNLVLNSIVAMPRGGTLRLEGRLEGDRVVASVEDTGVGMSEQTRESVFEPYFTTRKDGTGLGMSIVYGIVLRHSGTVRVDSTPGEGTRIRIDLPVAEPASEPAAPASGGVELPRGGGRVIVADDEESVRDLLEDVLTRAGHEVRAAEDGGEALALFEAEPADLVISDLGMRPVNGFEVARRVKAARPATVVVLLTGWGAEFDSEAARRRGVDQIVTKPFSVPGIVEIARAAVAKSREGARRPDSVSPSDPSAAENAQ